jgi:3-deoxy-D-manno-octulosonic-acid transferase
VTTFLGFSIQNPSANISIFAKYIIQKFLQMIFIYNFAIRSYYITILIASIFNHKARLWVDGRRNWARKFENLTSFNCPLAWFHCASLGEFEQGRPLMEAYREKNPNHKILLTFFSPSGYEVRKNYSGVDFVHYLPIDTKRNAIKFISIVKPSIVFFVKYEFWHHFLGELSKRSIPTYLVSGIFRSNQIFFRWYGIWNRRVIRFFTHIFVQNKNSKELLKSIGINNVTISGDTRFDRVSANAKAAERHPLLDRFCYNAKVIIAGSTWPKDEELLVDFINNHLVSDTKFIIATHEIGEQRIKNLLAQIGAKAIRFTQKKDEDFEGARVLILDTIGHLASAYGYGCIAYVGGGFGVGIHNTLEPATFGLPIIFGPNYQKFNEAKELIAMGAAQSVTNTTELSTALSQLLSNDKLLKSANHAAKNYVQTNTGATEIVMQNIMQIL